MNNRTLLTLGHGYVASALARALAPEGWKIFGFTRSPEKQALIAATGGTPVLWNTAAVRQHVSSASHILVSAQPDTLKGDPVLAALCSDAAATLAGGPAWIGYLSTTSVYGDSQGQWIDEDTPPCPGTSRGVMRLACEQLWRETGHPGLHIFRVAGIYGPGRNPFAKLRTGTARRIIKPGQVFSRIHVDDMVSALKASMARRGGATYNLCDNEPAPPEDVIAFAARLLGVPVPPAIPWNEADLSPMARSFYSESKRVDNRRLREELGVKLRYPDYRAGLCAILAKEQMKEPTPTTAQPRQ